MSLGVQDLDGGMRVVQVTQVRHGTLICRHDELTFSSSFFAAQAVAGRAPGSRLSLLFPSLVDLVL